jgi:MFS family permease
MTYASSSFNELSKVSTVATAASIVLAIVKPPVAKISDVVGRAEAYIFTISCYILGYILCASSSTFNTYAGGYIFYALGQGGTSMLDSVMVSDLSSMRWRGFSYNIIYLPFLVAPWIGAQIVDSVVDGIGWRWGIGMFAILMPFTASFIIITLLVFQHRAKKAGIVYAEKLGLYQFFSRIDIGGVFLLGGGFAMLLLPITLAATTTSKWHTAWIDVLIALGCVALIALYPYERYIAKHPVVPVRYFTNISIVVSFCLGILDNMGFGATHTYLYAWSLVAHDYSARTGIYLAYTNGVMQAFTGMTVGLVMYKTRSYKWLLVAGATIRMIGYGVMIRLRTNDSSTAELFIVQIIQGLGSGIIETIMIVAAQIVVPHAELAQVTALISLSAYLGDGIGSAIAGGIYTDTLRERLAFRLDTTNQTEINTLFNSITGVLPEWGTPERTAVNEAV